MRLAAEHRLRCTPQRGARGAILVFPSRVDVCTPTRSVASSSSPALPSYTACAANHSGVLSFPLASVPAAFASAPFPTISVASCAAPSLPRNTACAAHHSGVPACPFASVTTAFTSAPFSTRSVASSAAPAAYSWLRANARTTHHSGVLPSDPAAPTSAPVSTRSIASLSVGSSTPPPPHMNTALATHHSGVLLLPC
jgi:hypothetical protein